MCAPSPLLFREVKSSCLLLGSLLGWTGGSGLVLGPSIDPELAFAEKLDWSGQAQGQSTV